MSTTPGPAFLKIWLMVMPAPLENAVGSVLELDAPALVTVCVTVWLVVEPHPAITKAATPPTAAAPVTGIHRLSLRMAICSLLIHRWLLTQASLLGSGE